MTLAKKESAQTYKTVLTVHLLGQLQRDESFGLCFYALTPKLEFGADGSMEDKILFEALSLKGTDRRVMAYLL